MYTLFEECDTFGMKVILPCGPLTTKHVKKQLYTYAQIANTNSAYCLSYRYCLKYETINMFSCLFCIPGTENVRKDNAHVSHYCFSDINIKPYAVNIDYNFNASLFETLLLSHAPIIQQNMADSECTGIKDSSYLRKGLHTEKEQYQLF